MTVWGESLIGTGYGHYDADVEPAEWHRRQAAERAAIQREQRLASL
jgi:hypothetical protein